MISFSVPRSPSSPFEPTFRSLCFPICSRSPATYCADQKSHSCRPLPNYSVGGIHHGKFTFPHTGTLAHARASVRSVRRRDGRDSRNRHAWMPNACGQWFPPSTRKRASYLVPLSIRSRPVHPFCGQMGFSRPHPALTYSPRYRT